MNARCGILTAVLGSCAITLVGSALGENAAQGGSAADGAQVSMPFELAFSHASVGYDTQPSFSADGRLLAYTVHTPPGQSPKEHRFTATGTPALAVGDRLFVADARRGKRIPVGPQDANCWRPTFSPDATQLVFYCDAGGVVNLWVHDLAKAQSRRVSPVAVKPMLWGGDEPQWSRDGQEVFVPLAGALAPVAPNNLTPEASAGAQVVVHRAGVAASMAEAAGAGTTPPDGPGGLYRRETNAGIAAINLSSGDVRTLVSAAAQPAPSVSLLSPTGKWLAYLSVYRNSVANQSRLLNDILVVPSAGGTPQVLAGNHTVTATDYFLNAYVWHPTRDQLFWVQDQRLWTVDLTSGADAKPRELAPQLTDVTVQPIVVTRDGSAVIVGVRPLDLHDYRNPHPRSVAVVPLNGGPPHVVPLPSGEVLQSVLRYGRSVAWQPQPDTLTIQSSDMATAETIVTRLDLRSGRGRVLWRGLAKLEPAGALPDHSGFIAALEDLNTPVDYYRFTPAFNRQQRLSEVEPRVAGIRFGPAETFVTTVPQFDGSLAQVTTALLLPPGAKRGDRLPTLVFLYPGSKVSKAAAEFGGGEPSSVPVSLLTTRGYAVLLAELPIGPEGKPGNPATEMVDTLMPQIYRAAELGYTDIQRVAVSGQSYGGYGTAAVISGTGLFRAAVAIAGLYDLPGDYAWMDKTGADDGVRWSETGQGRMGGPPWSDLQRYVANSPFYLANRIHTPLLLLHGQTDEICRVEDARKMFNALRRLGQKVELAEYAGEGHVVTQWSLPNAVDAARRMVEFLDRYMKGRVKEGGAG